MKAPKWKSLAVFAALLPALHLAGCLSSTDEGGTETGNPTLENLSLAISDSIDPVSTGLFVDSSDQEAVSVEQNLAKNQSSSGCSDTDPIVQVTAVCSDSDHTASLAKSFGTGCDAGGGTAVTGTKYLSWFNMGDDSCPSTSSRPRFFKYIQGIGSKEIISTDQVPPGGSCGTPSTAATRLFPAGGQMQITSCTELSYSDFESSSEGFSVTEGMDIASERRLHLLADGSTASDHLISTPIPLTIRLTGTFGVTYPVRDIVSGETSVRNNADQYTVRSVFENLRYDPNVCSCHPISGTVSVTVTDNQTGAALGSGSVVFDAEQAGTCDSVQASYQGEAVSLSLGTCQGI